MERKESSKGKGTAGLVQLDHAKGGKTVAVTHDHLSSLPPDNGTQKQVSGP